MVSGLRFFKKRGLADKIAHPVSVQGFTYNVTPPPVDVRIT